MKGAINMPIDLSKIPEDDELIPEGIYKLQIALTPGGYGADHMLKVSSKGTLAYLSAENTVVEGDYAGRTVYDMLIVEAVPSSVIDAEQVRKNNKTVQRGRGRAKRILASARNVDIKQNDSEALQQALTIGSWKDLHGLVYWAQVGIEPAQNGYRAKNNVEHVLTPADVNWPGSPGQPKLPVRPIAKPKHDDFDDSIPF
jgi:hypothetical protein